MLEFVRKTLLPDAYHGQDKTPPFFEGWYFKLVDADGSRSCAVIPGIYKSTDKARSHAFIQVSDGASGEAAYFSFPVEDFSSAEDRFDIRIHKSRFTRDFLELDIEAPGTAVSGSLAFLSTKPWPVTFFSPGVMGWYAWAPFMECYHGVVSMDHSIEGRLDMNGRSIDFTGGRGYTEKDWGRSFPSAYVWMQSNHFSTAGTSLTSSVAVIPWVGRSFAGFTAGILHEGILHRFATYTGARLELFDITDGHVSLTLADKRHRLEILASRTGGSLLRAPTTIEMDRRVTETLNAAIDVTLSARDKKGYRILVRSTGIHAGLEAAGDLARLRDMWMKGTS